MDYTDIVYYMNLLVKEWGKDGEKVVTECFKADTKEMSGVEFLKKHCLACNQSRILLTGIKRLYPKVWDAIPENMGDNAGNCIIATLKLLKIDF